MQRKRAIAPIALAVLLAACARKPQPPQDLSVTFFDVGQADAALIRTPENQTIVVDTGHNGRTAELLRGEGIQDIDLLVLSHAHADHTGGLAAILDAFPVHEIWYSGLDYKSQFRSLLERAERFGAITAGAEKRLGKLTLSVLHPESLPLRARDSTVNNHSLVLRVAYPTAQYLFPGDCEMECWEEMFKYHRSELRANVLKAAHHGSENGTTSGVLGNVRPQTFVISCGAGNEFGHPEEIVLKMVQRLGAQIFRTDQQGTIRCLGTVCAGER
jgi:competence protein ComEC